MLLKRFSFLTLSSIVTLVLCFASGHTAAETLERAVESALNFHPSVEAAIANRDAVLEARKEKYSDFFPKLNVRATGAREFSDNSTSRGLNTTRGIGYSWLWEGSVTLSQMLFDGFETLNRVDAAQARRISANHNIVDVRESLALRTVLTYLDILRLQKSLDMLRGHSGVIEDYRKRIRSIVDEGAADETMAVQAHDIHVQLKNTIASMGGQLRSGEAQYTEITGHLPESPMNRPVLPASALPGSVEEATRYVAVNHPALQAAAQEARALAYDAEAERSFWYPDFTGEVSYLKKDLDDVIGGESRDAKALVRMNWDISVGGGQLARARKAKKRHYESQAQKSDSERQRARDIRVAWADMDTAAEQKELFLERVGLNEVLLRTNKAQFEGARINLLQLLQANNTLFNSKMAVLNGEYRLLAAQYSVLANMGKLQDSLNVVVLPASVDDSIPFPVPYSANEK